MVSLNVLHVDKDENTRESVRRILTPLGYKITPVGSAQEAQEAFQRKNFDIAIIDLELPDANGIELTRKIKTLSPDTQIVMTTFHESLDSAILALRSGAYDYLKKPFSEPSLLTRSIQRATEKIQLTRDNIQLIRDLKQSNDELEKLNKTLHHLAIKDGLTQLYNHRYFHEIFETEIYRSARHDHPFGLVFFDIDHFKKYNDTHGHLRGDELLKRLAELVRSRFRRKDVIARYGGEEFIILLPETSREETLHLAELLRSTIEQYPFPGADRQPGGRVSISLGVASFPENGQDIKTLVDQVDKALYRAKNGGRNQVVAAEAGQP